MDVLRKKYPKWAHRRDARKKRRHKRRRSRSRSRRRRKKGHHSTAEFDGTTTDTLLVSLLQQLLMPQAVARKHGENVLSGLGRRSVRPDHLAPVRSETGIDAAARCRAHSVRGDCPGPVVAQVAQRVQPPSSHPCQRGVNHAI